MIIAFSGKIGSGKDISMLMAAHYINTVLNPTQVGLISNNVIEMIKNNNKKTLSDLLEYYLKNINFQKAYFGKNVKKIACILLGCTLEDLEDINFKNSLVPDIYIRYKLNSPSLGIENLIFAEHDDAELYYKNLFEKYKNIVQSNDYTITKEHLKVRDFLVMIGNDFGRNFIHPNTWVNSTMMEYKPLNEKISEDIGKFSFDEIFERKNKFKYHPNWFITDCRYKNEAESILKHGGIIIRLTRTTEQPEHIAKSQSEIDLDDYDFEYVIDNSDGDLENLYNSISKIISKIELC